jgi:hypothetical protein
MRRLTGGVSRAALLLTTTAALGCARMGPPPGGPPDFTPPQLVSTNPESLSVLPDFDGWASFQFDEIVSEGGVPNFGTGRGALEQLVMISPDSGVPRVRWHRSRIEVRPRQGWRPGTVYRIEFDRGLTDLSRNVVDTALTLTFTTGAPRPTRYLSGRAVDWAGRRFIPNALITATYTADSLVYRSLADSAGRFHFGPLPDGELLLSASIEDGQPDRRLSPTREAWDTVRLAADVDSVGEIWAYVRDTLPPRIAQSGVVRRDSFAITLTLTQPADPTLRLGPEAVSVLVAPDSVSVPVASLLPEAAHDSLYAPIDSARRAQGIALREAARRDSLKQTRADSLGITVATLDSIIADSLARLPAQSAAPPPAAVPPTPTDTTVPDLPTQDRPVIGTRVVIRLNAALTPGTRYLIELRGVRAMSGQTADTLRTQLVLPAAPAAADSASPDSVARDTVTTAPDTLPPPARDTTPRAPVRETPLPSRSR